MSQNTELIVLCPESSPKFPAPVSQPLTSAGPGEAAWEQQALGRTCLEADQCPSPLLPAVSQQHSPPPLPGVLASLSRSAACLLPGKWIPRVARLEAGAGGGEEWQTLAAFHSS